MPIRDDIARIPHLKHTGCALVDLVEALSPGVTWAKKSRRWVPSKNFVTFTIQSARAQTIALSLRGHPEEFPDKLREVLRLRAGRGNGAYSDATLRSPKQLPAAAWYIQVAHALYVRGGARVRKCVEVREA